MKRKKNLWQKNFKEIKKKLNREKKRKAYWAIISIL